MKEITFLIIFILTGTTLFAQEVVASAGKTKKAGNIELSWTLGETVIKTVSGGTNIITQGFHQTKLTVTALDEIKLSELDIKVYPNPTSEFVIVHFNDIQIQTRYALFDFSGKLLRQQPVTETDTKIDMKSYAGGTYLLKLIDNKNQSLQTFKIVKK